MYPLVFGGLSIYPLAIAAIAPIPIIFLIRALQREGAGFRQVVLAMCLLLAAALLGGKLFSLVSRGWPSGLSLPGELTGGMRFSGVVVAVMLVLPLLQRWLLPKVQFLRAADVLAMTLVVAVCAGRIACILTGCCTGAMGNSVLYFSYAPGSRIWYQHLQSGIIENSQQWSEPVLALHGLFLFASCIAAVFLLRFDSRRRYDGQVFLLLRLSL
jgi:prolipoprotein diacylglyceryltransferase